MLSLFIFIFLYFITQVNEINILNQVLVFALPLLFHQCEPDPNPNAIKPAGFRRLNSEIGRLTFQVSWLSRQKSMHPFFSPGAQPRW